MRHMSQPQPPRIVGQHPAAPSRMQRLRTLRCTAAPPEGGSLEGQLPTCLHDAPLAVLAGDGEGVDDALGRVVAAVAVHAHGHPAAVGCRRYRRKTQGRTRGRGWGGLAGWGPTLSGNCRTCTSRPGSTCRRRSGAWLSGMGVHAAGGGCGAGAHPPGVPSTQSRMWSQAEEAAESAELRPRA